MSTPQPFRRAAAAFVFLALNTVGLDLSAQDPAPQTPPVFRGGTELIAIDAAVVDDRGVPVEGLTAADFQVRIDGAPRQVVAAQFIRQDPPDSVAAIADRRLPFSTNESAVGGRLVLLVFDLEGIAPGEGRAAAQAAGEFIDELAPSDRVGLFAFPNGVNINFTADRELVRQGLNRIVGRGQYGAPTRLSIGLAEALQIDRGDSMTMARVTERECLRVTGNLGLGVGENPRDIEQCQQEIRADARNQTVVMQQRATETLRTLRALFRELRKIDAPKTLVWVSEGLAMDTVRAEISELSAEAAAARTTVHVVHLDTGTFADASRMLPPPSLLEDRQLSMEGLGIIAGVSRGAVFSSIGTGSNAFSRIAREMTAYYLLSVEPDEKDRDGRAHDIRVEVAREGLTVRARRSFEVAAGADAEALTESAEQQVLRLLEAPLIATEVPLKVATYSLRQPGNPNVQLVVTSEIGRDAVEPFEVPIGYLISTPEGKVVKSAFQETLAKPQSPDTPGPLEAVGLIEVPPGTYTLRLAVIDPAGRKGSVDHTFEAGLDAMGDLELADLLLAPAHSGAGGDIRLVTDPVLEDRPYNAVLEIYPKPGAVLKDLNVQIEVADELESAALTTTVAQVLAGKDGKVIAHAQLPVELLPPGDYVARAVVQRGAESARQGRPFRLVKAAGARSTFGAALSADVGEFKKTDVLTPELLSPALARARELDGGAAEPDALEVATRLASISQEAAADPKADIWKDAERAEPRDSLLATFLRGLAKFQRGRLEEAAGLFRASVRFSPDFLPGIFYLGSCYAAGNKGREAVGAWQTSLVGDDSVPAVFRLLVDGYLRVGDQDGAISALEEAAAKWPDNREFALRAAQARAARGQPHEALASLLAWIERTPGDAEMTALALQLAIADVAERGSGSPDAVQRLRQLLAAMRQAGQPPSPLAERWLVYLDRKTASP